MSSTDKQPINQNQQQQNVNSNSTNNAVGNGSKPDSNKNGDKTGVKQSKPNKTAAQPTSVPPTVAPGEFVPVRTRSTPAVAAGSKPLPHNTTQQVQNRVNYASIVNKADNRSANTTPVPTNASPVPNENTVKTTNGIAAQTTTANTANTTAPTADVNTNVNNTAANTTQQQSQAPVQPPQQSQQPQQFQPSATVQPRPNGSRPSPVPQGPQFVPVGATNNTQSIQQQQLLRSSSNVNAPRQQYQPVQQSNVQQMPPTGAMQIPAGLSQQQYEQFRLHQQQQQMYTRNIPAGQPFISPQLMRPGMLPPNATLFENLPPNIQHQVLTQYSSLPPQQQYAAQQQLLYQHQQRQQQQLNAQGTPSPGMNSQQFSPAQPSTQPSPVPSSVASTASPSLHPQFGQYGQATGNVPPTHTMLPGTYQPPTGMKPSMPNVLRGNAQTFNAAAPAFAPGSTPYVPPTQPAAPIHPRIPVVPSTLPPGVNPYAVGAATPDLSAEAKAILEAAKAAPKRSAALAITDDDGSEIKIEPVKPVKRSVAPSVTSSNPSASPEPTAALKSPAVTATEPSVKSPTASSVASSVPSAVPEPTAQAVKPRSQALPIESPERELTKTPVVDDKKQNDVKPVDTESKQTDVTESKSDDKAVDEITAKAEVLTVNDDTTVTEPVRPTSVEPSESSTTDESAAGRKRLQLAPRTKPIEPVVPTVENPVKPDIESSEPAVQPIVLTIPAPAGPPYVYSREFLLQFQSQITTPPNLHSEISRNANEILVDGTSTNQQHNRRQSQSQSQRNSFGGGSSTFQQRADERNRRFAQQPVLPPTKFDQAGSIRSTKPLQPPVTGKNNRQSRNNNQRLPPGEQPMNIDIKPLEQSESRWTPNQGNVTEFDKLQKKIFGVLNKLTSDKFDVLSNQIVDFIQDNTDQYGTRLLKNVVSMIYEKALTEAFFSAMYAELCVVLSTHIPESEETDESGKKLTFRRMLLNECQHHFEQGVAAVDPQGKSQDEFELESTIQKRRMLGLIKFIGELFKRNVIIEKIMHQCVQHLVGDSKAPVEEDVELLCNLLTTVGQKLDSNERAQDYMNSYFDQIKKLSVSDKLSSRIRFMCLDLIELRAKHWIGRKKLNDGKSMVETKNEQPKSGRIGVGAQDIRNVESTMRFGSTQRNVTSTSALTKRGSDRYSVKNATPTNKVNIVTGIVRSGSQVFSSSSRASSPAVPSPSGSKSITNEQYRSKIRSAINDYVNDQAIEEVKLTITEINEPELNNLFVTEAVACSLSHVNKAQKVSQLCSQLQQTGILTRSDFVTGLVEALNEIPADIVSDVPKAPQSLATMLVQWLHDEIIAIELLNTHVQHLVESGVAIQITGEIVVILHKTVDDATIKKLIAPLKFDTLLPPAENEETELTRDDVLSEYPLLNKLIG